MSVQKNHTALAVLFGAVCAVLLPASCQRDVPAGGMSREQELDITVSAVLPSVPVSVKSAENPGDGTSANRCILEVYENGVFSGARYVAPVQDMGAVFEDVHLIAGGSYELVFWADCASEGGDGSYADLYYGTEAGLTQIALNTDNYINSEDGHDAFCAVLSVAELSDDQPLEATLTRPFGQIRLYTDDLDWLPEPVVDLSQIRAEVAFSHIFTVYNALTGEMSGQMDGPLEPVEVSVPVSFADDPTGQISFDYFLAAPEEDQTLIGFTLTLTDAATGSQVCAPYTASSIPLRRNYITNVYGNFLTEALDVTIDLIPAFSGIGETLF